MKIIFSSENLKTKIEEMVYKRVNKIRVDPNEILFFVDAGELPFDVLFDFQSEKVEILGEVLNKKEFVEVGFEKEFTLDIQQWMNVYNFLNQLPHQPVVLQFEDLGDELGIEIINVNVKFNSNAKNKN